jgi:hypothetical protein
LVWGGRAKGEYFKKRFTPPAPSSPHLRAVSLPGCGRAEGGLLEGLSGLTKARWKKALAEGAQRNVYLGLDRTCRLRLSRCPGGLPRPGEEVRSWTYQNCSPSSNSLAPWGQIEGPIAEFELLYQIPSATGGKPRTPSRIQRCCGEVGRRTWPLVWFLQAASRKSNTFAIFHRACAQGGNRTAGLLPSAA